MFRRHLPNIVTMGNLAVGVLAVIMALENQVVFASWLILLAAILDFTDGFLARMLDASSALGKQLDSFADLISFGMAPSAIAFKLMEFSIRGDIFSGGIPETSLPERLLLFSSILLVLFAAMRLAEFNLREESQDFSGMPTPAMAILISGLNLGIVYNMGSGWTDFILRPLVLLLIIVVLSILMISRIPMLSLKFHRYGWNENQIRYLFLVVSGILLIILQEIALPVIILLYLLLSISISLIRNIKK